MRPEAHQLHILFVCFGNICRSPLAEGLLRNYVLQNGLSHCVQVDSAGTHAYMLGDAPDEGSDRAALLRGVDIGGHRARLISPDDFELFDMILVMDEENLQHVSGILPEDWPGVLRLTGEYAGDAGVGDIPDPYGQKQAMFEYAARLLEQCFPGLLQEIRLKLSVTPD